MTTAAIPFDFDKLPRPKPKSPPVERREQFVDPAKAAWLAVEGTLESQA